MSESILPRRPTVPELLALEQAEERATLADLGIQSRLDALVERAALWQAQQAEAAVLRGLAENRCSVDVEIPGYVLVCDGKPIAEQRACREVRRYYLHGPLDPWPFRFSELPVQSRGGATRWER